MVYFISQNNNEFIKIGYIKDIGSMRSRLSNIQTGNPYPVYLLGVIDGDEESEKRYHWRYQPHKVRGEWFLGEPIIGDVIAQIEQGNPCQEMTIKVQELYTIHAELMDAVHR